MLADDRHDVRGVAHPLHILVGNHDSCTTVTPAPPSFQRPSREDFTRGSSFTIWPTRSRSAPVPLPWMMRSSARSARSALSIACSTASSTSLIRMPVSYTHLRAHETRHDLVC